MKTYGGASRLAIGRAQGQEGDDGATNAAGEPGGEGEPVVIGQQDGQQGGPPGGQRLGQALAQRVGRRIADRQRRELSPLILSAGAGAGAGFRESAVLVLLVPRWTGGEGHQASGEEAPGEGLVDLLFTVRTMGLPTHAGQISFPGGKRDPEDTSLEETALREATEELGLSPQLRGAVRLLGRLDDVPTPAGFIITPVVALLSEGDPVLLPSEREVTEVFYVSLEALRRAYHNGGEREFLGVRYTLHEYLYERWRIWGATAAIVNQLLAILDVEGRGDGGAASTDGRSVEGRGES